MPLHPKTRRTLELIGWSLCGLVLAIWIMSQQYAAGLALNRSPGIGVVGIVQGSVGLMMDDGNITQRKQGFIFEPCGNEKTSWMPQKWSAALPAPHWYVTVPLWMVLIPILAPTLLLTHKNLKAARLARIGHCSQCGYDRVGLDAAAPCPECNLGAAVVI